MLVLFIGILAFIIAGTDDFFNLMYLRVKYPKKFLSVFIGTFLGLLTVLLLSIPLSKIIPILVTKYQILNNISIDRIIGLILIIFSFQMIYETLKNKGKHEIDDNKFDKKLLFLSFRTFILNGFDNLAIYTAVLVKYHSVTNIVLFSFGNIISLLIFCFIIRKLGKKYDFLNEKIQSKIHIVVEVFTIILAIYLLVNNPDPTILTRWF